MDATQINPLEGPMERESWQFCEMPQQAEAAGTEQPKPRRLPIRFPGKSLPGVEDWPGPATESEQAFEELLSGMLVNSLRPEENSLEALPNIMGRLCALLGVDRWGLWLRMRRGADSMILTQSGAAPIDAGFAGAEPLEEDGGGSTTESVMGPAITVGSDFKLCLPWLNTQLLNGKNVTFSKLEDLPAWADQDKAALNRSGIRSSVLWPLMVREEVIGAVSFDQVGEQRIWAPQVVRRLELITEVLASATARKLAEELLQTVQGESKQLKEKLQAESDCFKNESKIIHAHGGIIGHSHAIKRVLHQAEQVARAECAVLINGETGTGKELIAMEIHRLSRRKDHPMVLVNCAALPSALVESELFGREKGAYTGALTSQVGRFEVADGSTIFLDEVGELSLEVQAKLLRVLQQGEFQRLGSPKTHKVDVRVIAATNRDLAGEVRKGKFREDLYYRLKVFPIEIPPLRDRIEDIPLLVFAFLEEFSTQMGKKITKVPSKAMAAMQKHAWPGNIRELRNVIEHSVILS